MNREQTSEEQTDSLMVIEYIAFGFVMGVLYCTVRDILALRHEARWVRRLNHLKQAWHETTEDIRLHMEAEKQKDMPNE